jgi:nucleolar protein 56
MNIALKSATGTLYFANGKQVSSQPKSIDITLGNPITREVIVPVEEIYEICSQVVQNTPRSVYFDAVSRQINASVTWDTLVMQATRSIDEADVSINLLAKRLREWFEWHNPEFSRSIPSHEEFANAVIAGVYGKTSMGAVFSQADLDAVYLLAAQVSSLSTYKEQTRIYIETVLRVHAPNFLEVAGAAVGAKLLSSAGSVSRLAMLPASTIQLLGAEKALFRHLKTGSRSPKYGLIYQHVLVQRSRNKGTTARSLANAICLCIRKDYFGTETKLDAEFVQSVLAKIR